MDPRISEVIKSVTDAAIKLAETKGVEVPSIQTLRGDLARRDAAIRSALDLGEAEPVDATVLSRVSTLRPAAPVARPAAADLFPELGGVPLAQRRNTRRAGAAAAAALPEIPEEEGPAAGANAAAPAAGAGAGQQGGRRRVRRHRQKTQKRRRVHFRKV